MLLPLHLNLPQERIFPGGGTYKSKRSYMWTPETRKTKIVVKTDSKSLTPERKVLKQKDPEFDQKRYEELQEILEILRQAVFLGSQVTLFGYRYVSPRDIKKVEQKVQREEEDLILLLEII